MQPISAEAVKSLREQTGLSVMQCKKALEEAGGDVEKALALLAQKSGEVARKKGDRTLGAGTIGSYVHGGGQVAAMVLLSCETDFVAKNEEFISVAREIAMHITAMRPQNVEELLEQPFIKDESKTIQGLIDAASHKFGERIVVSKYDCFSTRD